MRGRRTTIGALARTLLVSALLASGMAGVVVNAGPADAFGTYSKSTIGRAFSGQNREHEFITRAALACAPGVGWTVSEPCFEPKSIDQLAGREFFLGAVGQPDILEVFNSPEAHCDDADYLAAPGSAFYPKGSSTTLSQARDRRNLNIESCVRHLKAVFDGALSQAGGVLDGTHLDSDEVGVRPSDCPNLELGGGGILASAKCVTLAGFGRALHGTEDFYSHSNWSDVSDPARVSIVNPPGLNNSDPWTEIDLGRVGFPLSIPTDLTTGCAAAINPFHLIFCRGRVNHDDLNKDEGDIDPAGVGTSPTTKRGMVKNGTETNFAKVVRVAGQDTKNQWKGMQERLRAMYPGTGDLVICALSRDDPVRDCDFTVSSASLLPQAVVGVDYTTTLHVAGPSSVTGWAPIGGALPPGLMMDATTGTISGKPTDEGTSTFTAQATAASGETATQAFDLTVVPVPAPEVAFASDRTGRFQVWRAKVTAGSTPNQVTTLGSGTQEARRPDWSGAGQLGATGEIAYQFGAAGVRGIHVVPPTGVGDVRLTPSRADETEPSWSPDGRFVAYVSTTTGASDLWIHAVGDPATTDDDLDYMLFATSSQELRPAWSPDGNHIAFVSSGGASGPDAEIADIDVQNVGGTIQAVAGSFRLLTQNTFVDFDPTWSPDSRHIAYSSTRPGNRDIYRLDPCGSAAGCEAGPAFLQLTTNAAEDTNPAWSPDGTTIAFVTARDLNKEIYLLPADAGETDPTALVRLTTDSGNDDDPTWGPGLPHLVLTQEPSSPATVGKPFTLQPVITAKDGHGNTLTGDSNSVVTLTLGAASTAVLSCPGGLSQTLVDGVATFGGCSIDHTGQGKVIRATASGMKPADSVPFDVGRGSLTFVQQPPATTTVGLPMPAQPGVAVLDAAGNVDTHDSSTAVSLGVSDGPAGGLGCASGLTVHAVDGIATYSGCALDVVGAYTLRADAPDVQSATSTAVGAFPLQLLSMPGLVSLSPTSAPAGGGSTVLTLDGENFTGGSMAQVNGEARPTTFVSSFRLTTSLTAADLVSAVPIQTLDVSVVDQPTGAESVALPFVVVGPAVADVAASAVPAGTGGSASTAPTAPGSAGVTATLTNLADNGQATLVAATYTGNPTPGAVADVGAGFVDVRAEGAGAASDLQAEFYYPASASGPEDALQLLYWTGATWAPVKSSGGTAPARDADDDLDGTVSGGRLSVTFDGTSTPTVGGLTGTVLTTTATASRLDVAAATPVAEGGVGDEHQASLAVTLSATPTQAVKVGYATQYGEATAGVDYVYQEGTLVFAAGATGPALTQTVVVPILGDASTEADESFFVQLFGPTGGATLGHRFGRAVILDDDGSPPVVSVAASPETVVEGAPSDHNRLDFTVTLSSTPGAAVRVPYATNYGTAVPGVDYTYAEGVLDFAPGASGPALSRVVSVDILGDTTTEADESLFLQLYDVSGAAVGNAFGRAVISNDDGDPPVLSVANAPAVGEGNTPADNRVLTFEVTLSATPTTDVVVHYSTMGPYFDSTATSDVDYTARTGSLSFPAGAAGAELTRTVVVPIVEDSLAESDEKLWVQVYDASGARLAPDARYGSGIITNDD